MRIATTVGELNEIRDGLAAGRPRPTVAFVPTMGALHRGHRSLFTIARNVADVVVVSIFVNPLQFGPDEDYARYPRVLEEDLEICRDENVDLVLAPRVSELYPAGRQVTLESGQLGSCLEGHFRPGHFNGMLTVVAKLFNIVRPDKAIFGAKDAQQIAVVRKMTADLNYDVDIVTAPTIRDDDGLAISTSNRYLLPHERTAALALSAGLRAAAGHDQLTVAVAAARSVLKLAETEGGLRLDYVTAVNPQTFAEVPADYEGPVLLLVAARVGTTRLIDNVELQIRSRAQPDPVAKLTERLVSATDRAPINAGASR